MNAYRGGMAKRRSPPGAPPDPVDLMLDQLDAEDLLAHENGRCGDWELACAWCSAEARDLAPAADPPAPRFRPRFVPLKGEG